MFSTSTILQQRTPTATQSATYLSRRPVLSVRRRISNTPATFQQTTTPSGDLTTTESTSTSKYIRNRNRQTAAAAAAAAATSIPTTRNYLNNKSKTKFTASVNIASLTTSPAVDDAATVLPTSANDITHRHQNVKYPTTTPAFRRKFQTRRLTTTTPSPTAESATEQPRTSNPLFKRRFSLTTTTPASPIVTTTVIAATISTDGSTTIPYLDGLETDDNVDQVAKSSIHTSHFNQIINEANEEDNEGDSVVKAIKRPAPPETPPQHLEAITRRMDTIAITTPTLQTPTTTTTPLAIASAPTRKPVVVKRRPHTNTPVPATQARNSNQASQTVFQNRRRPHNYAEPFDRLNSNQEKPKPVKQKPTRTYRPPTDYDYYDDEDVGVVGNTEGQQLKVILHGRGIIECLDQGNFPHPLSCRKFISCAKFETGGVVGWEYTCPKGLSYDPVGGMCNWAAGLGCKE